MKDTLIGIAIVALAAFAGFIVAMDASAPRRLPHRPINVFTNWGQGRAPESNHCPPGTIRFETDDGLFLECYRGNTP